MSFLSISQLRDMFDQLSRDYEFLSDNRTKLAADCEKLQEYIEAQVTQIQTLTTEFERLRADFVDRGIDFTLDRQVPLQQEYREEPAGNSQEEQPDNNYEVEELIGEDKIPARLNIPLVAEIVDVSVICSTAFSPDGNCLAIGSDKTLRIYNIETDAFIFQYTIDEEEDSGSNHVRSIAWTADCQKVVCGGEDGHIRVFQLPDGELIQNFSVGEHSGEVFQVQISSSGDFIAAVTGDGAFSMFSMDDFSKKPPMVRPDVTPDVVAPALSISPDDKIVAVGYSDCTVALWDVETGQLLSQKNDCHKEGVYAIKFLPNNRLVTASLDHTIKIWDVKNVDGTVTLEEWKTLTGHTNYVLSLATDPEGKWLLSGSKDLSARLSYVETGDMVYSIRAHNNSVITVSFSPTTVANGARYFCTGSGDCIVKIWSMQPEDEARDIV